MLAYFQNLRSHESVVKFEFLAKPIGKTDLTVKERAIGNVYY